MIPAILIFVLLVGIDCMLPPDEPEDGEKVETLFTNHKLIL